MANQPHQVSASSAATSVPSGMMAPPLQYSQMQMQQQQPQEQLVGSIQPSLHYEQVQKQQLQMFWRQQMQEMEKITDFKTHQLPLARIKKIMKADEDVKMISAEAPVLFAKACELFILELTLRSWIHTEENKRRTLQRNDIAGAISRADIFDFLVDIVPRDELKEEGLGVPWLGVAAGEAVPYYSGAFYPNVSSQPLHQFMPSGAQVMGQPQMPPNAQMMFHPPQ
ncbi:hypothetical protein O6H91_11G049500 [Diphasiastrum complanatum]|uniref:Uncharacterized protein n=1 Tax=Diphasiastrum complanatum TaxID=34168 RepID=A0ACC2C930_DIPCM|nr:hypothetical protein O6H91_Y436700 [Diphasiastrum complanatum]KAJ7538476.1 hypothetical protein O6H91_11G049500 [Diphasiastrum complanatum]